MRNRTTLFAAFAADGTPCINVYDFNRARLETLVSDRLANGEAMPGEHIKQCVVSFYNQKLSAIGLPPVKP